MEGERDEEGGSGHEAMSSVGSLPRGWSLIVCRRRAPLVLGEVGEVCESSPSRDPLVLLVCDAIVEGRGRMERAADQQQR